MDKKQLTSKIEKTYGFFLTQKQIAEFLNIKDPHHVSCMLQGFPRVKNKYFVDDVADAILEERKW